MTQIEWDEREEPSREVVLGETAIAMLREAFHALGRSGHRSYADAVAHVVERWDAAESTERMGRVD